MKEQGYDVARDGSPVAVYLALPAGDTPLLVHAVVPPRSRILELGCGAGRVTRVLVALGHEVTAVDDSAEMLEHVTGAHTVLSSIEDLALPERYDVVLAASHLVDGAGADDPRALLEVAARHVRPDGLVLVERYPPGWLGTTERQESRVGPVGVAYERVAVDGDAVTARATYTLGDRRWVQDFTAREVGDERLAESAGSAGLRVERTIDDEGAWVLLRPA